MREHQSCMRTAFGEVSTNILTRNQLLDELEKHFTSHLVLYNCETVSALHLKVFFIKMSA